MRLGHWVVAFELFQEIFFPHLSNLVHDSIFDSLGDSHRVPLGIDFFELTTRLYCVILLSSLQERMSYSCHDRFLHVTSPLRSRDSFPSIDRYPETLTKPQYPWYSHSSPLQPWLQPLQIPLVFGLSSLPHPLMIVRLINWLQQKLYKLLKLFLTENWFG